MRRIYIDSSTKAIQNKYLNHLKDIGKHGAKTPSYLLDKLLNRVKRYSLPEKAQVLKYMNKLIADYSTIIKAEPNEILGLIKEFEKIIPANKFSKIRLGKSKLPLSEEIVNAMRYDYVQDKIYRKIANELGIRACIYCNANLVLAHERIKTKKSKNKHEIVSRYELDHFYPKSNYPFLSTNFFNLFPVCGYCNRLKSKQLAKFQLYTNKPTELNAFQFSITDKSIAKFRTNFNSEDIELEITSTPPELMDNHDRIFGIRGLYDTQKDICGEILLRAISYSDSYKAVFLKTFPKLKMDAALFDRLVVGNYVAPEDIHRRPLAKLYSDLWFKVTGKYSS